MAARSRILVLLLLFLLSTEHSFAVDQNQLASLVNELLRAYHFDGMFSLAVSIPLNQNQNQNQDAKQIIQEVLESDPAKTVEEKLEENQVYVGRRMVAAKALKREDGADHAESRVVDKLDQLSNSPQVNKKDLLLFYVYASPCVDKCTDEVHPQKILKRINSIRRWESYAVVFSKIFKPSNGPENTVKERIDALQRLATHKVRGGEIGLENIFRCDRNENRQMQCVSCSSNGQVAHKCVSDKPPSANRNAGSSSTRRGPDESGWIIPKKGRGNRVRRDISSNTGDSSSQDISESNWLLYRS